MCEHNYNWITHTQKGEKITSVFWDWCCMEKIIADYRDNLGISDSDAHRLFWEDVRRYDPEDFYDCLSGEPLEKAIGDGRLDEIRADYLRTLNIDCEKVGFEE